MIQRALRIVFMGSPEFAVPTLQTLAQSRHEVVAVLTNRDKPRGRGNKVRYTPVKQAALDLGIETIFQPKSLRPDESYETIASYAPDLIVVAAYGKILPQRILDIPPMGCLNVHASLLPMYRGAAPINWCIVRGESVTGITIMQMEAGLDTGPMLLKKEVPIGPLQTAQELHDELYVLGGPMMLETIDGLLDGTITPEVQNHDEATWAPMLSKDNGQIDWSQSATQIANMIRGFNPWPGAYSNAHLAGQPEGIYKLHLAEPVRTIPEDLELTGQPGTVLSVNKRLWVECGEGVLSCLRLQAPGRKALNVVDFVNGVQPQVGDRFLMPPEEPS